MPFDSNGNYSLPPGYFAITGQTIFASQHNPPLEDIAQALTSGLRRNGSSPMLADLPMGGFKITGLGTGEAGTDAVTKAQLDAIVTLLTIPTGEVSFHARTTAPSGWIKANGGTIGNASSGATTRANADTSALFSLLWGQFSNTILPIFTSTGGASTRGASAAADFAANKRLTIHDGRGEFLRGWDDGRGVDASRTIGTDQTDLLESHTHTGTASLAGGHDHEMGNFGIPVGGSGGGGIAAASGSGDFRETAAVAAHTHPLAINATGGTETRPRNVAFLCCIKL